MNAEFIELVERYDTYKQCADALIDRLETCLQQDRAVIIKGKVPLPCSEAIVHVRNCINGRFHGCP